MPTRIAPYKNDPNRLSKKKHNRNTKEPETQIKCQNLQSKVANPVPAEQNQADLALRKQNRKF